MPVFDAAGSVARPPARLLPLQARGLRQRCFLPGLGQANQGIVFGSFTDPSGPRPPRWAPYIRRGRHLSSPLPQSGQGVQFPLFTRMQSGPAPKWHPHILRVRSRKAEPGWSQAPQGAAFPSVTAQPGPHPRWAPPSRVTRSRAFVPVLSPAVPVRFPLFTRQRGWLLQHQPPPRVLRSRAIAPPWPQGPAGVPYPSFADQPGSRPRWQPPSRVIRSRVFFPGPPQAPQGAQFPLFTRQPGYSPKWAPYIRRMRVISPVLPQASYLTPFNVVQPGYRPRWAPPARVTRGLVFQPPWPQGAQGVRFPLATRQPGWHPRWAPPQRVTRSRSFFPPLPQNSLGVAFPLFARRPAWSAHWAPLTWSPRGRVFQRGWGQTTAVSLLLNGTGTLTAYVTGGTLGGVLLPPAASAGSFLPARLIFETAAGAPLRLRLPPAGSGTAFLPAATVPGIALALAPAASSGAFLPAAVTFALPAPPQPARPAWQRDIQAFAIAQERQRHVQALWQYGELAVFVLMWTVQDFEAGLVGRCQRCFLNTASGNAAQEGQIASAYGQGSQFLCPDCLGTQFEGGFRARIVRPAIFADADADQQFGRRGVARSAETAIETTPDFRVRAGDFCFRSTDARYRLRIPRRTTLRTGFATPWQSAAAISYNQLRAGLEDRTSAAYIIPPSGPDLEELLGTYTRLPADFSFFEIIRAPLIPEEAPPPAASGRLQPNASFPLVLP